MASKISSFCFKSFECEDDVRKWAETTLHVLSNGFQIGITVWGVTFSLNQYCQIFVFQVLYSWLCV